MLTRQYLNFQSVMTDDTVSKRAQRKILRFFRAYNARRKLQGYLRAVPQFVDKWGQKATLVRKMVRRRRRFLTRIFEREKRTMLSFYQGKKKFKKLLTKL